MGRKNSKPSLNDCLLSEPIIYVNSGYLANYKLNLKQYGLTAFILYGGERGKKEITGCSPANCNYAGSSIYWGCNG